MLASIMNLVSPYIMGDFIDQLMDAETMGFIYRYFAIFTVISISSIVLGYVGERLYVQLQTRMGYQLNSDYIQKLQHASLKFTDMQDTAYLNQRINSDASSLISFCIGIIKGILINAVTVMAVLGLMFLFHPVLAGVLTSISVVYFLLYVLFRKVLYQASLDLQESWSKYFAKLNEQLFSIRYVKLHGLFKHFAGRLNKGFAGLFSSALQHQRVNYAFSSLDRLVSIMAQMTLLIFGGREILAGRLTIGQYIIVSSYFTMMIGAVRYFFNLGKSIQSSMVSYNRLRDLDAGASEPNGECRLDKINSIELISISFAHDDKRVLTNINQSFKHGHIYVVVGPNGVGKSTLIDVLVGLQAGNYTGKVLYNGSEDIDMYDLRNRLMGISEQEPALLADTIASNIVLDKPGLIEANESLFNRLVKITGLESYISSLPKGLETQINENAANISGGEKQKLSILRVLLKDPDVIILDEPTSALDATGKRALRVYLDEIKKDKIIIIVTHDSDFIDICQDKIIQMTSQ